MHAINKERLDTSLRAWRQGAETAIREYEAYRDTAASEAELISSLEGSGHATDSIEAQSRYDEIISDHYRRLIDAIGRSQQLASTYFQEKRMFDSQKAKP